MRWKDLDGGENGENINTGREMCRPVQNFGMRPMRVATKKTKIS